MVYLALRLFTSTSKNYPSLPSCTSLNYFHTIQSPQNSLTRTHFTAGKSRRSVQFLRVLIGLLQIFYFALIWYYFQVTSTVGIEPLLLDILTFHLLDKGLVCKD